MGWAKIGSCWYGEISQENKPSRIMAAEAGRAFLRVTVGKEPSFSELKLMQGQRTEVSIGLEWHHMEAEPEAYIRMCRAALHRFSDAIDWSKLEDLIEVLELIRNGDDSEC